MKQLRIYFRDNDLTALHWCYLIDGVRQEEGLELNDLFKQCALVANDTVLIVPQFWVYETSIDISDKNAKQLLAAAAYQLEEQLAEDVDDLHFAKGDAIDNKVPFLAITHAKMQSVIEFEKTNGLKASFIVTEMSLCQQPDNGNVNVIQHEEHYLFKSLDNAQNAICHQQQIDFFKQHYKSQHPDTDINHVDQVNLLCSDVEFTHCINLKQKSYSQSYAWQALAKKFIFPLVLVALVILVSMLNFWQDNQQLKIEIFNVQLQQNNLLDKYLKESSSTKNAKTTLIKALQKQQSTGEQSGFIFDFHQFLNALKQVKSIKLIKVDYRNNQLVIDVKADNLQQLDQLIVLMKKDFKVTVAQMDSVNNESQGRFVLEHQ